MSTLELGLLLAGLRYLSLVLRGQIFGGQMTSLVDGFMLKALHVFQVRTLSAFGFGTRVTLSNKSHNKPGLATDYRVDLTVYSPDGKTAEYHEDIATLPVDSAIRLDCTQWQTHADLDQVMIFHLMPVRLLSTANEAGEVNIDRAEIWGLFTAQDHYVEYYRPDGFSSGVLYQSGAFNYRKFSREATTVIQAPKVFLDLSLDTVLSVLHTGFDPGYEQDAVLNCALLNAQGHVDAQWSERIKPFTAHSISMKARLREQGVSLPDGPCGYTLLVLCENAALLPLILNMDVAKGTLAVEHSLPPMYYGQAVTGPVRAQMIANLRNSGIFSTEAA